MSEYPSIFDFATKEATVDAMVMWFLECYRRGLETGDSELIDLGKAFVKELLKIDVQGVPTFEYLEKQYYCLDVFACLYSNNCYYPIIFENKTNSTLHSNQLERYCQKVDRWYKKKKYKNAICNITYVYFKTGYIFEYEKQRVNESFGNIDNKSGRFSLRIISLREIISFMKASEREKYKKVPLYDDYLEYCKKELSRQIDAEEQWNTNDKLCYEIAQGLFYCKAFGSAINTENCWVVHSGRIPNTCYSIRKFDDESRINFRFEPYWKKNIPVPYLEFQYYREKSSIKDRFESLQKLTQEYVRNNLNDRIIVKINEEKPMENYKGVEICRFSFGEDGRNKPEDVAEYICQLAEHFTKIQEL